MRVPERWRRLAAGLGEQVMRYGMVIDLKRCNGNAACTVACKVENGSPPGISFAPVLEKEEGRFPTARRVLLPVLCMHCQDPPCLKACPTGSISKRADGIVVVNEKSCCGSRACMAACPYGAIHFYEQESSYYPGAFTPYELSRVRQHQVGTVQKCNFCVHRVEQGRKPACVDTCPTNARIFGDLDDPGSEVSRLIRERGGFQLRPEAGTNPSVYFLREQPLASVLSGTALRSA